MTCPEKVLVSHNTKTFRQKGSGGILVLCVSTSVAAVFMGFINMAWESQHTIR